MADPLQSTSAESVALANDFDPTKSFPGYRQMLQYGGQLKKLQELIEKHTSELAEAKKAPPGDFQRAHIHQINNVLFRSGYELDQTMEEFKRTLVSCIEELQIDWSRIKSNWIQNEDQIFQLIVIQAKCDFLKLHSKDIQIAQESLPPLHDLVGEIEKFTSAHLSSGATPDNCLDYMTHMVGRLGEVLAGAYDLATEMPDWRATLVEPKPGSLSVGLLNETNNRIKQRINEVPAEIARVHRLLPEGNWRKETDLRQEIYAFAEILFQNGPLHRIPVRDVLLFLDNNPDSRLRRVQMDKLKSDAGRCKTWLETREHHELMLEQSVGLAKEGNYLQAEKFMAQTEPYFNDINYALYRETAKFWLDQREQLRKRLDAMMVDLKSRLEKVFRQPWIPLPRTPPMKRNLTMSRDGIEKEITALSKYSKTDFYHDTQPIFEEARHRLREIERWAKRKRDICFRIALGEAFALALIIGSATALYIHTLEVTRSSVTVSVVQQAPNDTPPVISLGSLSEVGYSAKFSSLREGIYPLQITAPGYYPRMIKINLAGGKQEVVEPIKLIPIAGYLRFEPALGTYDYEVRPLNSEGEEGAAVASGTVLKDESMNSALRPGRYRVYFKQGAKNFDIVMEVTPHNVSEYTPNFMFTTLLITSEPQGAEVSINGKPVGRTPFTTRLAPINYSLDVALPRYTSYYAPIELPPGSKLPIHVKLKREAPLTNVDNPATEGQFETEKARVN